MYTVAAVQLNGEADDIVSDIAGNISSSIDLDIVKPGTRD